MWCKGEVKSVELNSSPPYLETVFWVPGSTEMGTGEMATKKVSWQDGKAASDR